MSSEDRVGATLTLLDGLKASIEFEEQKENGKVADLAAERRKRKSAQVEPEDTREPYEVSPLELLKIAIADIESGKTPNVTKCYLTIVSADGETWNTTSYRSCMNPMEETAFRSLGLQEAMAIWQCSPYCLAKE